MIEFHTEEVISEERIFPHGEEMVNEKQGGPGNVSFYRLQNETEEWTVRHLSESCQYSVLSLRRNFQPDYPAETSEGLNNEAQSHEVENQIDGYHFIFPRHPKRSLTDSNSDA
jgi:hypothetical protein